MNINNINIGDKRYIISDAAKLIDVESHVLRYWEDELNVEVPRNEMGHRYYTDYYIQLFKKIKELKDGGFQLKAIKLLLPELMEMNENTSGDNSLGMLKEELFGKLMSSGNIDRYENDKEKVIGQASGKAGEDAFGIANTIDYEIGIKADADSDKNVYEDKAHSDTNNVEEKIHENSQQRMEEESIKKNHLDKDSDKNNSGNDKIYDDRINDSKTNGDGELATVEEETGTEISEVSEVSDVSEKNSKLEQFQMIITEVVSNALKENTGSLGREVSEIVSDNVIKEMDYLMHLRDKQEEERFKKLDETIRNYQVSNREKSKANKGLFSKLKKL